MTPGLGILLSGTGATGYGRVVLPLEPGSRKKYQLLGRYGAVFVVGYHGGRGFRRVSDEANFYLSPILAFTPLRAAVHAFWITAVAVSLGYRRRVEILISESPYDGVLLLLARRILGVVGRRLRVVVQVQGDWESVLPLVYPVLGRLTWVWRPLLRAAVARADVVRVVSRSTATLVHRVRQGPIVMFPTWSDYELFSQPMARSERMTAAPAHVLVAGVLTQVKGIDVFLHALADLRQAGTVWRATVAGDGPQRGVLERLALRLGVADWIIWTGHVHQARLMSLMDQAAVLVVPSRSEGLGRVALEGMLRGCVVVASNIGGLAEVITDGRTGFLFRQGETVQLASLLRTCLADRELCARVGAAARTEALTRISPQRYADGFRELLCATLEARR